MYVNILTKEEVMYFVKKLIICTFDLFTKYRWISFCSFPVLLKPFFFFNFVGCFPRFPPNHEVRFWLPILCHSETENDDTTILHHKTREHQCGKLLVSYISHILSQLRLCLSHNKRFIAVTVACIPLSKYGVKQSPLTNFLKLDIHIHQKRLHLLKLSFQWVRTGFTHIYVDSVLSCWNHCCDDPSCRPLHWHSRKAVKTCLIVVSNLIIEWVGDTLFSRCSDIRVLVLILLCKGLHNL